MEGELHVYYAQKYSMYSPRDDTELIDQEEGQQLISNDVETVNHPCNEERESQHSISNHLVLKGLCKNKYLVMTSILASTGGILFGYDIGVISGALIQLTNLMELDCFEQEMVTSSVLIGAFFMSLFGGILVDFYGRKMIIVLSSVFYTLGAIVTMLSSDYTTLVFGRLILGMAISLSSSSECVYVSEISPANFRGSLVAFNELGITLGFLLAYCANAVFSSDELYGWRWMFGSSLIVVLIMVLLLFFLPKSPRFLLMKGHVVEAKSVLCQLRQMDETFPELLSEWVAMKNHTSENIPSVLRHMQRRSVHYSLFIAFGLMVVQQMTGQPTLLLYSSTVLVSFGFSESAMAAICSVGIGVAKLLSTIICIYIIEKYDRKYFLIFGSLLMSITLFIISISAISYGVGAIESCSNLSMVDSFYENKTFGIANSSIFTDSSLFDTQHNSVLRWVILFSLIVFVSAYAFSFGPVTWLFLSELFPTSIRGKAFSVSISINWLFQLLISVSFLSFSSVCGSIGWPYMLSSVFTLISIIFLYKCLPETRGKSLEEIQSSLSK